MKERVTNRRTDGATDRVKDKKNNRLLAYSAEINKSHPKRNILADKLYRVFQKKMHKVCHVINFEPFALGS